MQETYEKIVVDRPYFKLVKINATRYRVFVEIENKHIYMANMMNFGLMKLMYELNKDTFEEMDFRIDENDDSVAHVYTLSKSLFKDLGVSQRYSAYNIKKIVGGEEGQLWFDFVRDTEYANRRNKSRNAIIMPIERMCMQMRLIDRHKLFISEDIFFAEDANIGMIAERIFAGLMKQMFKKTVRFVEGFR